MRRTLLLMMLLAPCLTACGTPPPRLADGLPGSNLIRHDPAWDQRVRERFPVGSDEKMLLTELRRERFVVNGRQASYRSSNIACTTTWAISWTVENGQITDVAGQRSVVCL